MRFSLLRTCRNFSCSCAWTTGDWGRLMTGPINLGSFITHSSYRKWKQVFCVFVIAYVDILNTHQSFPRIDALVRKERPRLLLVDCSALSHLMLLHIHSAGIPKIILTCPMGISIIPDTWNTLSKKLHLKGFSLMIGKQQFKHYNIGRRKWLENAKRRTEFEC